MPQLEDAVTRLVRAILSGTNTEQSAVALLHAAENASDDEVRDVLAYSTQHIQDCMDLKHGTFDLARLHGSLPMVPNCLLMQSEDLEPRMQEAAAYYLAFRQISGSLPLCVAATLAREAAGLPDEHSRVVMSCAVLAYLGPILADNRPLETEVADLKSTFNCGTIKLAKRSRDEIIDLLELPWLVKSIARGVINNLGDDGTIGTFKATAANNVIKAYKGVGYALAHIAHKNDPGVPFRLGRTPLESQEYIIANIQVVLEAFCKMMSEPQAMVTPPQYEVLYGEGVRKELARYIENTDDVRDTLGDKVLSCYERLRDLRAEVITEEKNQEEVFILAPETYGAAEQEDFVLAPERQKSAERGVYVSVPAADIPSLPDMGKLTVWGWVKACFLAVISCISCFFCCFSFRKKPRDEVVQSGVSQDTGIEQQPNKEPVIVTSATAKRVEEHSVGEGRS
jgi:hypothetical protein